MNVICLPKIKTAKLSHTGILPSVMRFHFRVPHVGLRTRLMDSSLWPTAIFYKNVTEIKNHSKDII